MAILRNHSCGHHQRICTRCLSVGCNDSNCPECIGNNSTMVCKCCGSHDVMSMENHQYLKQSNARKAAQSAKDQEQRIKNIEQANNVRYIDNGGNYDNYGSSSSLLSVIPFSSIFTIRNIIISIICCGLSTQFKYSDYDGVIAFVVAIINIIGALIGVVFLLLLQLVDICGF